MNRSFVIRSSRISLAQKQAYASFYPLWGLDDVAIDWKTMFPTAKRCIVEIGFGMGEATREVAVEHPDWGIVGIEMHVPGIGRLLWSIHREGLGNIRVVRRDAVEVFRTQIPHGSVDAVHIWFPDPWPKKRHHKRRLIRSEFVETLTQTLKIGGIIHIATDWEPYAEQILQVLTAQQNLKNRHGRWAPKPDYRPRTKFEGKGVHSGRTIRDIVFEKIQHPSSSRIA